MYYENLELVEGEFYNLFVPEITNDKASIYDIDEIDTIMLKLLKKSKTISCLLESMKSYFDDDVIKKDYEIYESYIVSIIQQLLIKKAIKPFKEFL